MTAKKLALLLGLVGVFSLLVAACGGDDPTPTPAPTPTPVPQVGEPTPTPDPFLAEWDALIAAAQAEGELVTFICCGLGRVIDQVILPRFEEKFGVRFINSTGSSRQQTDKVFAERAANVFTVDVWIGGTGTVTTRLIPAGVIANIRSLLIHPEVLDKDAWFGGDGPLFVHDGEGGNRVLAFMGNGGFYAEINYNTDLVNGDEITSFYDLLDPKWKGLIIARDPRLGGTLNTSTFYYNHPDLGPDFLTRLFTEMDVTIVDDARQAAERLAIGRYAFCLFSCAQEVRNAKEDGLPVEDQIAHLLKEAPSLSVGAGAIYAVDSPPHPAAQKLFINWFLSKEGQTLMQEANGEDSSRVDIPKDAVNPALLRQPGVEYVFNEVQPDFVAIQNEAITFLIDLLAELGY